MISLKFHHKFIRNKTKSQKEFLVCDEAQIVVKLCSQQQATCIQRSSNQQTTAAAAQ